MKKILLSLFWIVTLWLINFSSADYLYNYITDILSSGFVYDVSNWTNWVNVFQLSNASVNWNWTIICFYTTWNFVNKISPNTPNSYPTITFRQSNYTNYSVVHYLDMVYPDRWSCLDLHPTNFSFSIQAQFQYNWYTWEIPIRYVLLKNILNIDYPWNVDCPSWSSQQCQSEYNLIPVSSIDYNYCESNNLCPLYTGWNCETWDSENWSALYINDIQHNSASVIDITIPEEISRDYTNENDLFDLDIQWYNTDTEYIEWLINIQNTVPTKDDFNQIISSLIPLFIPWLVIILFIIFTFRLIKKIF